MTLSAPQSPQAQGDHCLSCTYSPTLQRTFWLFLLPLAPAAVEAAPIAHIVLVSCNLERGEAGGPHINLFSGYIHIPHILTAGAWPPPYRPVSTSKAAQPRARISALIWVQDKGNITWCQGDEARFAPNSIGTIPCLRQIRKDLCICYFLLLCISAQI